MTTATRTARTVEANDREIYVEQAGQGPDVLLIGGLGDTVEACNSSSTGWPTATA
jgi:hypothetical protein